MSLPVVYLPEAQDDIDAAYAEYEQRLTGLGERFLDALRIWWTGSVTTRPCTGYCTRMSGRRRCGGSRM
jgi:hypothetical protein